MIERLRAIGQSAWAKRLLPIQATKNAKIIGSLENKSQTPPEGKMGSFMQSEAKYAKLTKFD